MVGNRECNTERGFKNQLYIELGYKPWAIMSPEWYIQFIPVCLLVQAEIKSMGAFSTLFGPNGTPVETSSASRKQMLRAYCSNIYSVTCQLLVVIEAIFDQFLVIFFK